MEKIILESSLFTKRIGVRQEKTLEGLKLMKQNKGKRRQSKYENSMTKLISWVF